MHTAAHLREHRTTPRGLADLVNWGFLVDDGVVLQKDGSLVAGWRYRGPDPSAATLEELDALSRHVNDALLPYTDSWMFHVDAIRRPAIAYAPSTFPDAVTQLIDDERRDAYEAHASRQFETAYRARRHAPAAARCRLAVARVLRAGRGSRAGGLGPGAGLVRGPPSGPRARLE